eukprot:g13979.t1
MTQQDQAPEAPRSPRTDAAGQANLVEPIANEEELQVKAADKESIPDDFLDYLPDRPEDDDSPQAARGRLPSMLRDLLEDLEDEDEVSEDSQGEAVLTSKSARWVDLNGFAEDSGNAC